MNQGRKGEGKMRDRAASCSAGQRLRVDSQRAYLNSKVQGRYWPQTCKSLVHSHHCLLQAQGLFYPLETSICISGSTMQPAAGPQSVEDFPAFCAEDEVEQGAGSPKLLQIDAHV